MYMYIRKIEYSFGGALFACVFLHCPPLKEIGPLLMRGPVGNRLMKRGCRTGIPHAAIWRDKKIGDKCTGEFPTAMSNTAPMGRAAICSCVLEPVPEEENGQFATVPYGQTEIMGSPWGLTQNAVYKIRPPAPRASTPKRALVQ